MYAKFFKRLIDLLVSLVALIVLWPFILVFALIGAIVLKGNPFFLQPRPGKKGKDGKERIFYLVKLRTMANLYDENGRLLPDEKRLGRYGALLRSTSLDELPSLINIIGGSLSLVGPRPQLVEDMLFMTEEERRRHDVKPGLTGLAQVMGRNSISWEKKFEYDLQYIDEGITFRRDLKIFLMTFGKVLKRSDVVREGTVSDMDLGLWLVKEGKITKEEYEQKRGEAKELLKV